MPNGGAVATLSLATSENWRDKQSGEQKEKTEWHRVVLSGNSPRLPVNTYIKVAGLH